MRRTVFMPVLLALLIAGLCLTNLTGCAEKETQAPDTVQDEPAPAPDPAPADVEPVEPSIPDPAAPEDGPLTEEELRYFNEQFFNGEYMNIRNQFLSSSYESPEWIDLYWLFYCGSGWDEAMTDEEWAAFEAAEDCSIDTDIVKISSANVDMVLMEHMGVTLEETNQLHWDNFRYMPDYDAYYIAHGDTNYRGWVEIASGTREGELLHLYYDDWFFDEGWKCVTLRETGSGGYHFVSNMPCGESDVPNS